MPSSNTHRDREILTKANGPVGKLAAFLRLSGPGWLQSAITLGGGSLGGALYLGVLGGSQMLWIQVLAILIGVVMLSSIAYVTLSTRVRPYQAINQYVNPVLGVGWITATILANMIWIMPQFSLCFDALSNNVLEGKVQDTTNMQILVSAIIAAVAMFAVVMSFRPGWMSKLFDLALKVIVGLIVCCFVWAIVYLTQQDELDWNRSGEASFLTSPNGTNRHPRLPVCWASYRNNGTNSGRHELSTSNNRSSLAQPPRRLVST